MPSAKDAFLEALGGGGPKQAPADLQMESDDTLAPMELIEESQEDMDPTTQEGDTIFLDPEMFAKKPKKGQEFDLRVRVEGIGSKISLTPLEVSDTPSDENEEEDIDID